MDSGGLPYNYSEANMKVAPIITSFKSTVVLEEMCFNEEKSAVMEDPVPVDSFSHRFVDFWRNKYTQVDASIKDVHLALAHKVLLKEIRREMNVQVTDELYESGFRKRNMFVTFYMAPEGKFTVDFAKLPVNLPTLQNLNKKYLGARIPGFQPVHLSTDLMHMLINLEARRLLTLNADNVLSLRVGAEYLNFIQVKKFCENFISYYLTNQNLFQILEFANDYGFTVLKKYAEGYLCNHLREVYSNAAFCCLSPRRLSHLLGSDDLVVLEPDTWVPMTTRDREVTVFEAVLQYLSDSRNREHSYVVEMMLDSVRMLDIGVDNCWNIFSAYPEVRRVEAIKRRMTLAGKIYLAKEDAELTDLTAKCPFAWSRRRVLARWRIHETVRCYGPARYPSIVGRHPANEDLELCGFEIKIQQHKDKSFIGGLKTYYKDIHKGTVELEVNKGIDTADGTIKVDLGDDCIVCASVADSDSAVHRIVFFTLKGDILGPYGDLRGDDTDYTECLNGAKHTRLHSMEFDRAMVDGVPRIVNLGLRWLCFT
ncbi:uncharacterized protein LOC131944363 [Physella acuta]|uniref:uncharacterized protein LOC131944363 n=1 Tax=Physella acuta TaxID=109671 RepID=UPI0027DDF441|nr:uncharacterized protein LOC131944363 [Physella acuta]